MSPGQVWTRSSTIILNQHYHSSHVRTINHENLIDRTRAGAEASDDAVVHKNDDDSTEEMMNAKMDHFASRCLAFIRSGQHILQEFD